MKSSYLRLFAGSFSLLLIISLGIVWLNRATATAPPPLADFEPTYAPREAAARVAQAQALDEQQRMEHVLEAVDASQLPLVPTVYFSQTGHHLSNRTGFLDYWRANGQVRIFGYPITEEVIENGRVVQYFERARFEYHPELAGTPWQVQLGRVGHEALAMRPELSGFLPGFAADPLNGSRYFPETQHTIVGDFRYHWEKRGGVDAFGFPITEQFEENGRLVQYFERARFEHYPEHTPYYGSGIRLHSLDEVQLSHLGRQLAQARGVNLAAVAQLEGAPQWTPALWARHINVNLSTQWLTAYEGDIPVYSAPIATGRDGFNTPAGNFAVYDKLPMQTMRGSARGETWNVPNVPWVMYVVGGVALHGTYWHNAFGTGARMSHGCINLTIEDAQWLYEWADIGTTVTIHY
jgi:hypothetical protein